MSNNWIEWKGGECPVPKGTLVDVKHGDGSEHLNEPAGVALSAASSWGHHDGHTYSNIIAYRLHQPEQEAWNAVWDGEGLPPVGTECELKFDHWSEWERCNILCIGERRVFVRQVTRSDEIFEGAMSLDGVMFRPIRTEAERKRDEFTDACIDLDSSQDWSHSMDYFRGLYNAIAAGKIPGIKLEE